MENRIKTHKRKAIRIRPTPKKIAPGLTKPKERNQNQTPQATTHKEIASPIISSLKSTTPAIKSKINIENIDQDIVQIALQKEQNLLNLIVKTLVKSTLEELYGKESH